MIQVLPQKGPRVVAKPPVIYAVFLFLAVSMDFLRHIVFVPTVAGLPLGLCVMAAGVALIVLALKTFNEVGTPYDVNQDSKELVTSGVYHISRNPIYLGLHLMYLGFGVATNNVWVLVLFPPIFVVMHYGVVLREEAYLLKHFGKKYEAYKKEVGRWV